MQELPTSYQAFIHKSRYARWLPEQGRREEWYETVRRYMDNIVKPHLEDEDTFNEIENAILNLDVMPSMRAMMTAGPAANRDNTCIYNCSYLPVDDPKAFDEAMFILLCGTGVGFSVERQYVNRLPEIPEKMFKSDTTIVVKDSKEGWAKALRQVIALLYSGEIPKWDVSKVRPAGANLKTFGGRASGPAPLIDLFKFTTETFAKAAGRKLNSMECHDIMCKIGEVVVVGGVRRCLPEGALVHTKRGLVPIEDVTTTDYALTSEGYRRVTAKFDQGEQETIMLETQTGNFECTPSHKMAVLKDVYGNYEWIRADSIKEGDRLYFCAHVTDGIETELPQSSYIRPERAYSAKPVTIPQLDTDMAWFLGYFHANGHSAIRSTGPGKRNSVISISVPEDATNIVKKCREQLERFGINARITSGDGACWLVKATSVELALWFIEHIKVSNEEFYVPDFIKQGTPAIRSAYVAGVMDGDGSIKTRPARIMNCVHKGYLEQLQAVCASLGFATRLVTQRPAQGSWKELYSLNLVGTKQETQCYATVGGYLEYKLEKPRTRAKEYFSYSFPAGMVAQSRLEDRKGYHQNHAVNCPIETWETIYGQPASFTPVAVTGISAGRLVSTWDIEVEDRHEFYCNGYLTHNSAMISLSNLSDDRLRHAKSGNWWETNPQRALSNNSVCYTEKPDMETFMREWLALVESKSGERGIFNRVASQKQAAKNGRRDPNFEFGTNPCSEIILRPYSFCNLSEVVVRAEDKLDDLRRKVKVATILGTIQSTYTKFPYLRKVWQKNAEEERLLGVSLTGVMDHHVLSGGEPDELEGWLLHLRAYSVQVNSEWAAKLGINQSTAITCNKPSGTVSQLVDCASGIHTRHSDYYIRTVRNDNKDPITQFMIDMGIPNEPCVLKGDTTRVFSFPIKAPENAATRDSKTAIQHLNLWLAYQRHFCEHKPSVTITVKDHEWMEVGAFVYKHFDEMSGVSFLPHSDHTYQQAPYQECTEEEYLAMLEKMPESVDWSKLAEYEEDDNTVAMQTLACTGGACEI